jgi:hypothetical protein
MIASIRKFLRDSEAAVAFETVILTPILIWAYMGSFVFFDAYRTYNTSVKATYMVADMLSRQTQTVQPTDIQGMANIVNTIIRGARDVEMRVSQVGMICGDYRVEWSAGVNGAARLFNAGIDGIRGQLPTMPEGERIVIVESFIMYEAPFDIGLTVARFDNFTISRPRYAGRVSYANEDTTPVC